MYQGKFVWFQVLVATPFPPSPPTFLWQFLEIFKQDTFDKTNIFRLYWCCLLDYFFIQVLSGNNIETESLEIRQTCSSLNSNEGLSVVRPPSVSGMFSPQLTHISSPFRLLQKFHWYKFSLLRTSYVETYQSEYWFVTLVGIPSPGSSGLVVPIVVSSVHHKRNSGA